MTSMKEEFKVGDVVALKSDPLFYLTITLLVTDNGNTIATCNWFNGGFYQETYITVLALKKVELPAQQKEL